MSEGRSRSLGRSLASCEAAGVFKPKARLGEPWETMLPSKQRSPQSGRHRHSAAPTNISNRNPRLAEPRLGLNYDRCFAAGWDNVNGFAGAAERRCRPLCRLHSSRWQVSQGSQSLALGLTMIAASQLVGITLINLQEPRSGDVARFAGSTRLDGRFPKARRASPWA